MAEQRFAGKVFRVADVPGCRVTGILGEFAIVARHIFIFFESMVTSHQNSEPEFKRLKRLWE
ncbi:MAG: hypothetical protein OEZ59_01550 [Deltaproteobacteria bacterium]|nr:hypothetical protein [Deltaproteobacteria bacterium]